MSNVINGNVPDTGLIKGSVHAIIGRDGYSAYQLAQKHGFVGTEEEWLLSLNGADGTVEFDELTPAQKESLRGEKGVSGVYIGSGNMPAGYNVQIDPNGDSFSADDLARMGSNPNLLDNWYFADPVNQRGKTEYTAGYTIDRWMKNGGAGTIAITNSGLAFDHGGGAFAGIIQMIESYEKYKGRTVTLSAIMDSQLYSYTFVLGFASGGFTLGKCRAFSLDGLQILLRVYAEDVGANPVNIAAVKLELGDKQTLAHQDASGNWVLNEIPDKGAELLKCQRYYQLFSSAEKRPSDKRDFRPELRTNATAANTGTIEIDGVTYYYADANL